MLKKYIKIALLLALIMAIFSLPSIQKKTILHKIISQTTKNYRQEIKFEIPYFSDKVLVVLSSEDKQCIKYISQKIIKGSLFLGSQKISQNQLQNTPAKSKIIYRLSISENLKECQFEVFIFDPYGNSFKLLLFFLLPAVGIFYLFFKISWLTIADIFRKSSKRSV